MYCVVRMELNFWTLQTERRPSDVDQSLPLRFCPVSIRTEITCCRERSTAFSRSGKATSDVRDHGTESAPSTTSKQASQPEETQGPAYSTLPRQAGQQQALQIRPSFKATRCPSTLHPDHIQGLQEWGAGRRQIRACA